MAISRTFRDGQNWVPTAETGTVFSIGPGYAVLHFPNAPRSVRVKLNRNGSIDNRVVYHGYRYMGNVEHVSEG